MLQFVDIWTKLCNINLVDLWLQPDGDTLYFAKQRVQFLKNLVVELFHEMLMLIGPQNHVFLNYIFLVLWKNQVNKNNPQ